MRSDLKRTLAAQLDATRTHLSNLAEQHADDADLGYVCACLEDAAKALEMATRRLRGESTRAD